MMVDGSPRMERLRPLCLWRITAGRWESCPVREPAGGVPISDAWASRERAHLLGSARRPPPGRARAGCESSIGPACGRWSARPGCARARGRAGAGSRRGLGSPPGRPTGPPRRAPSAAARPLLGELADPAAAVGAADADIEPRHRHRRARAGERATSPSSATATVAVTGPTPNCSASARQPAWRRANRRSPESTGAARRSPQAIGSRHTSIRSRSASGSSNAESHSRALAAEPSGRGGSPS
jgi:hypothetical protein